MSIPFSDRLQRVETSAIRELFKLLGKPGIISFAGGFPDSAMFDVEGIRLASEAALRDQPGAALQYGATEGHTPLREALAQHMVAKGVKGISAQDLIVTTGSQQALDLLGKTLMQSGDTVLVEAPTFLATIQCFRLYGPTVKGVAVDDQGVDVDALEAAILEHRPKAIYLIPTFGNPSGAMMSLERRLRVLNLAVTHRVMLIEDDPYGDLYFDAPPPPSLLALSDQVPGSRDWLIHCGSLSKVLSPGLRVGWLIAPPELLSKATMCKQFSDAHTSTFSQVTATHYLASGRMGATLDQVRRVYAQRAKTLCQGLHEHLGSAIDFAPPKGGMFVWARLTGAGGAIQRGDEFAKRAIAHNVAFVPGAPFFADHPDESTLRLSFATANETLIAQGCERLGQALKSV
jgi:DNA-binding transcriptional MocR family regulator